MNGGGAYANDVLGGGGRLGVRFPVGEAEARLGATGGGAIGNGVREFNVNRLDAGINKGGFNAGVDFDPNDAKRNWMLRMGFEF